MSFIMQVRFTQTTMKILENSGSFLNDEKEIGLNFPKQNLIPISPNIPQDNGNFLHWMLENFYSFYKSFQVNPRNYIHKID